MILAGIGVLGLGSGTYLATTTVPRSAEPSVRVPPAASSPTEEPTAEAAKAGCTHGCPEVAASLVAHAARTDTPRLTVFYDGDERPVRTERDRNGDGRVDEWVWLGSDGDRERVELDVDFDGVVDSTFPGDSLEPAPERP